MTKKVKISHLEMIVFNIDNMNVSESSINKLSDLIKKEQIREFSSEKVSKLYSNNLEQTIEKNLEDLEKNAHKPKVRIDLFDDCVSNFRQDIMRELRDLKYKS
jgi:uncharacterized membrane protein YheB (UPF0754 family)